MVYAMRLLRRVRELLYGRRSAPLIFYRAHDELANLGRMLARRRPLYDERGRSRRPFFIIGSGRSGNTLLRSILAAHPNVAIPPESYVLGDAIREYLRISYLPWPVVYPSIVGMFDRHPRFYTWEIDLDPVRQHLGALPSGQQNLSNIVDSIYRQYITQKKPEATIWGDKTPVNTGFLPWIDRLFPRARYIHAIRDGRDVVNSFLQSKLYTEVDQACNHWLTYVDRAKRFGQRKDAESYVEIRYEELVLSPAAIVRGLCNFLGIDFRERILSAWQDASELGDVPWHPHHANVMKPIDSGRIGSWRRELDAQTQAIVARRLGARLQRLDYEP